MADEVRTVDRPEDDTEGQVGRGASPPKPEGTDVEGARRLVRADGPEPEDDADRHGRGRR